MELMIYSVYDSKAEAFLQPFFAVSRGAAVRMFSDAAQDESHAFHKHAEDFTLFEVGRFDQVKGVVAPLEAIFALGTALQFVGSVDESPVRLVRGTDSGESR